jgi:nucleoside-diphosphate-sugar epimerase
MTTDWVILGCGYVGTRLSKQLLAAGARVRVCARRMDRLQPLAELGAELHALDAARLRAFGPALYGLQSPVVLYSIPPLPNQPAGEALRRAADAAMSAGAARFIYLGSTSVYGETPDGEVVDEATPVALSDGEAMVRIGEETAVETARLAGLHTAILRLAAIYGPGRGVRERLKAGNYQLVDDGVHWFSRVHVDDICGIVRAAAERAPAGAVYVVADDRPSTQREYAEWLAARLGVPLPRSVPSLAPGAPRRAVRNRRIDNALVKRELGYSFIYPSYVEGELAIEREQSGQAPPPPAPAPARVSLASPSDTVVADDQPFLQTLQQIAQLWMKLLTDELGAVARHLDDDRFAQAQAVLARLIALAGPLAGDLELFAKYAEPGTPSSGRDQVEAAVATAAAALTRAHGRNAAPPELEAVARGMSDVGAALARFIGIRMDREGKSGG